MEQLQAEQSTLLEKLKAERPFRSFEIKTKQGQSYKVGSRFAFGFNDHYVIVVNDRGSPVHLEFEAIDTIDVTAGAAQWPRRQTLTSVSRSNFT